MFLLAQQLENKALKEIDVTLPMFLTDLIMILNKNLGIKCPSVP